MDDSILQRNTKTFRLNKSNASQQIDKKSLCGQMENNSRFSTKLSQSKEFLLSNVTDKKQFIRLRKNLKQEAKKYFEKETNSILKQEIQKYKKKNYIQKIIDEYKNPFSKESIRSKHHQKVNQKLKNHRQNQINQQIVRLEQFLKKKQLIQKKIKSFLKNKQKNRLATSQRYSKTKSALYKKNNNLTQAFDYSKYEINQQNYGSMQNKNLLNSQKKSLSVSSRLKKNLSQTKLQQEDQMLKQTLMTNYLNKMKRAQQRLIELEIKKFKQLKRKKENVNNNSGKILIEIRQNKQQRRRQGYEKQLQQKFKQFGQKISMRNKIRQEQLRKKIEIEESKAQGVLMKKQNLHEQFMNKKYLQYELEKQKIKDKRNQNQAIQKILNLKKLYILKKQNQKHKFNSSLKKLSTKLLAFQHLNSTSNLPQNIIKSSINLLNQITDSSFKKLQIFQKTKYQLAQKMCQKTDKNKTQLRKHIQLK